MTVTPRDARQDTDLISNRRGRGAIDVLDNSRGAWTVRSRPTSPCTSSSTTTRPTSTRRFGSGWPPAFQTDFTRPSSWLNLVESWFSKLTQQRLRRSVFCSVQERVADVKDYLTHHNAEPKPFVWSPTVDAILEKASKCKGILGTHHYGRQAP